MTRSRVLVPTLVYAALCTAVVSSLGMLLVPSIAGAFHVSVATAQWMLTVNLLVGAVATPVMGRLSDGPHKKRLLLLSLSIVLAGSVVAALAPTFAIFLVGRAMQGLSYGIVPVTIAIARRYVEPSHQQSSISALSVTVATGIGVGYPLTGLIAGASSFRWAFWFAAIFVLTAILVVGVLVPAGPDDLAAERPLDRAGAVLLASGLGALLWGISEGATWGWTSPRTCVVLAAATSTLAAWTKVELRSRHPLINLRVLRSSDVLLANCTAIGLGAAMYIPLSIGSLVAQAPRDTGYGLALPVVQAGFVMFPLSVGSLVANRVVRRFAHKISLATLLPLGTLLILLASLELLVAHDGLQVLLLGMLLMGLGIGASYAAIPVLIARSVAAAELGSSVSFNQVLRTTGSSFGTALAGAVLAASPASGSHPSASGITHSFALGALICGLVLLALAAHALGRHRSRL